VELAGAAALLVDVALLLELELLELPQPATARTTAGTARSAKDLRNGPSFRLDHRCDRTVIGRP